MRFLLLLSVFAISFLYGEVDYSWESDFAKSLSLSKSSNKGLLLFFSGSDWSGPSMKMKKEILDNKEFRGALQEDFIFVEVDFPMHSQLAFEQNEKNKILKERFAITHFPCLLLLDQNEREITRLDYLPDEKEQLSHYLLHLVALDKKVMAAVALLENKVTISGRRLKELYDMAEELGHKGSLAIFLQEGMNSEEPLFFMLKSYQHSIQKGQIGKGEVELLREKLVASKDEGICYSVALTDFQALSKQGVRVTLAQVIAPLKSYLAEFGGSFSENVWRTEMMIAQVYMTYDLYERAYYYAKQAYEKAPVEFKDEIAHSLNYIEDQNGIAK